MKNTAIISLVLLATVFGASAQQKKKIMNDQILNYVDAPTQYVEIEGIRYAYRSLGKPSDVPIVCLQHFTGTLDNWDPMVINGLAKQRRVITIDNTGIGNSGGTTPDNVQDMTRDALKVIAALGIKKCDLLGFSLGGFIAQTIAVQKPELLRKIILVGTAPQGTQALHSFPQLVQRATSLGNPMESYLFLFATKSDNSRAKLTATLRRLSERKQDRDKETGLPSIQAQVKALTHWGVDPVTLKLSEIRQPVLIVQGSNDEMMNSASSMELFNQIPHAFLSYYPDASHGSFFQYPEMFVDQANFFLDKAE